MDLEALNRLPPPLRRVVVWRVMTELARGRPVGFDHAAAALRVAATDGPSALDAPGQRVERIGSSLVLTGRPPDAVGRWNAANPENVAYRAYRANPANLFRYPLSIPGEVPLPQANCVVSAHAVVAGDREREAIDPGAIVGNGPVAVVSGVLLRGGLAVLNSRAGAPVPAARVGGKQ